MMVNVGATLLNTENSTSVHHYKPTPKQ